MGKNVTMLSRSRLLVIGWVVVCCALMDYSNAMEETSGCPDSPHCNTSNLFDEEDLHVTALDATEPQPKALSMMAEDHIGGGFQPTPVPLSANNETQSTSEEPTTVKPEEPKGRALNFTFHEANHHSNNLANITDGDEFDLSDVTIRDGEDDGMEEMLSPKILVPLKGQEKATLNMTAGFCEKGGLTYENGEKLELGCDSICTCRHGKMECEDRCRGVYFRKGKRIIDSLCSEKPVEEDPCCAVMVCAGDTETEPLEMCSFGNKTYNRGDTFNNVSRSHDCSEVCVCEIAGKISCKPRCPLPKKTSESCVEIQDPADPCCKKVLCDVTLDDHQDQEKEPEMLKPNKHKIVSARQPNSTLILLDIDPKYEEDDDNLPIVEVSNDKENWNYYQLFPKGELFVKENFKFIRLEATEDIVEVESHTNNTNEESNKMEKIESKESEGECKYKGRSFKFGEEYNDGCESLCACHRGEMRCLKLECPTYFGVDVLDPSCVEWETIPPNFKASPPNCCPEKVQCKNNGSCLHQGQLYKNWEQLPLNVTGCEQRCYCEMGNVECQTVCPSVAALPPATLGCPPNEARLQHIPHDDCCMDWVCSSEKNEAAVRPTDVTKPDLKGQPGGVWPTDKQPSKVLGPLVAYENDNQSTEDNNNVLDPLNPYEPPHVPKPENPYVRPNKPTPGKNKIVVPSGNLPDLPPHPPQNHEDLLHFLQQHPEISKLPSGSVLEIHTVRPQNAEVVPVHVQGHHPAQDISLEDILNELHKNVHPFPPTPQFVNTVNKTLQDTFNSNNDHPYPPDFGFVQPQEDISVHSLEAVDPHTVRLAFVVPPVIVGLHGRVEVRYTFKETDDVNAWDLQVFAPPNDLIATPSLEFDLLDLVPDKEYKIKITITLRDLHNTPSSKVYKIKTPKEVVTTTLPPQIPIEPDMEISDINSTWVTVAWRKFTEYELQFIDGVQLRFRELEGKIYTATPLIHRAVTTYTIENLKPNTKYELGIFFIPFPGQHTELNAEHMVQFTTANLVDTYGFSVSLEVTQVKSTSVEISWNGVPYPEDKYVNIYRAIYQSDSGKEDQSTFKIAKRDSPTKTIITDLKPGTRYRLWLEVYLTNGKIKTSNVQDFITKPRAAPALGSTSSDTVSRAEFAQRDGGDYYGPLVIVAILATIAILSTLILLLILVRRHNQNKAAITPPSNRISQSAYDNPTYKVEIQQETMGL